MNLSALPTGLALGVYAILSQKKTALHYAVLKTALLKRFENKTRMVFEIPFANVDQR